MAVDHLRHGLREGVAAGSEHEPEGLPAGPRSRLVVTRRPAPGPHDAIYRKLIPARGLGLLALVAGLLALVGLLVGN